MFSFLKTCKIYAGLTAFERLVSVGNAVLNKNDCMKARSGGF
jgi:hypothetical protein